MDLILIIALSLAVTHCGPAGSPAAELPTEETAGTDDPTPTTGTPDLPTTPTTPGQSPVWKALAKPTDSTSSADTTTLCRKLGQRAKDFGISRLVIAFEGLASYDSTGARASYELFDQDPSFQGSSQISRGSAGYVLHGVLQPLLERAGGKIEFLSLPHDSQSAAHGSVAETCILAWLEKSPHTKVTLMGHSYGGHAVNQLATALNDLKVPLDSVFTLDPRTKFYSGSLLRTQNADVWLNFYQLNTPLLNGYVVPNADLNLNLSSTGVGHTGLPYASEVLTRIFAHML